MSRAGRFRRSQATPPRPIRIITILTRCVSVRCRLGIRYVEVTPPSRLVWTNEEGDEGGAVTTVTFEEQGGQTLLVVHDLYPSKEALDAAFASGSTGGMPEQLDELDELLATLNRRS